MTFSDPVPDADSSQISAALTILASGGLIGMPTETVYGLAADATNPLAIAAIYAAKGRPRFNPLISHIASLEAATGEGVFSPLALKLAKAFWPGPLTLVLPRQARSRICDLACAGLPSVALRVPAHPLALALLSEFERPLAAPSANISGRPSPTIAGHVRAEMGDKVGLVLDGGPCGVGLESAVVAVVGEHATLLRLGGLARSDIEVISGRLLAPTDSDMSAPASPGMILRHYAPRAPVVLNQIAPHEGGILIGFGNIEDDPAFNLSKAGDLQEAAARLFAYLRAADARNPSAIAVAPVPAQDLGEAINDRLARAAAGQKSG